uniref:BPTI/Kunitz inhibitor domain-containing protein n=1 Tax=Panagrolaimus davidi TaxID=227884 RepID=A0A914PZJ1_9BILA
MKSFFSVFALLFVGAVAHNIYHPHPNVNPICRLRRAQGTGDDPQIRIYYDLNVNKCVEFVYFGKGGNANRFNSKPECNAACKIYPTHKPHTFTTLPPSVQSSTEQPEATTSQNSESHSAICNLPLPPARNWPKDSKTAYAYDSKQNQCFYIYYDEGTLNANNFPTREACLAFCGSHEELPTDKTPDSEICALPPPPTKEWPSNSTVGFWYDQKNDRCEPIYYDEATKNGNCFLSVDECLKACSPQTNPTTHLPPNETTQTPEHPPKDEPTSTTSSQNNPEDSSTTTTTTTTSSHGLIVPTTKTPEPNDEERERICHLPPPPNRDWTDYEFTGYHYDAQTEECDLVYYDDATKNENLFSTLDECLDFCLPQSSTTSESSNSSEMPTSKATKPSPTRSTTKPSSDDVNATTFVPPTPKPKPHKLTQQEVLKLPQCALQPFFRNRCRANIVSYFFNITTMQCQRFRYGGCGATVNHYNSEAACEKSCVYKTTIPHPDVAVKPLHTPNDKFCNLPPADPQCSENKYHGYLYNPRIHVCEFKVVHRRCFRPFALHETIQECNRACRGKIHPKDHRRPLISGPKNPHSGH